MILINNATNLKQEKIQSQLTILIKIFSAKNPKEHFSQRNNKFEAIYTVITSGKKSEKLEVLICYETKKIQFQPLFAQTPEYKISPQKNT